MQPPNNPRPAQEVSRMGRTTPAAHESRDIISGGDRLLADALVDGVEQLGRYDATSAGYQAPADHRAEYAAGHACQFCIFYRGTPGPDGCAIVAADVDPMGGCRLGIYGQLPGHQNPDDAAEDMLDPDSPTEAIDESLDLGTNDADDDDEDNEDDDDKPGKHVSMTVNIDLDINSHNADGGSATEVDTWRTIERHTSRRAVAEWRDSGAGKNYRTIVGYASVFNSPSDDLGGFREIIAPGAFRDVLTTSPDVRLLVNHEPDSVIARTTNGSLELTEDQTGLRVWARVDMMDPDTSRVVGKMRAGLMDQMSFAFTCPPDGDEWGMVDDYPMRTVRAVDGLYDASIVTYPAYQASKVEVLERARELGKITTSAAPVIDPADGASSQGNEGEAMTRLKAKARSRLTLVTFNLTR